jgi:hypothetical protein
MHARAEDKTNWPFREIAPVACDGWNPPRDQFPSVLYHAAIVYGNQTRNFDLNEDPLLGTKPA